MRQIFKKDKNRLIKNLAEKSIERHVHFLYYFWSYMNVPPLQYPLADTSKTLFEIAMDGITAHGDMKMSLSEYRYLFNYMMKQACIQDVNYEYNDMQVDNFIPVYM